MSRLLLVEDDERLGRLITRYLLDHGFTLQHVRSGAEALDAIACSPPDLVLLDLGLPDMDGLDVCRALRPAYKGPLCIFSARTDDISQVLGLELGADDYIAKPMEPRVLLARVRAHLRRWHNTEGETILQIGLLRIDLASREVALGDMPVPITSSEFDLLSLLARNAGRVFSRDHLFNALRGVGFDGVGRSMDACICRLRRKLGDTEPEPTRIKTVRGKGYLFNPSGWQ